MKNFLSSLQLVSGRMVFAILGLLLLFHSYRVTTYISQINSDIHTKLDVLSKELEPTLASDNLFYARTLLWNIKPNDVKWMSFDSEDRPLFRKGSLKIGDLSHSYFDKTNSLEIVNYGLKLGMLNYGVSPIDIFIYLLKKDLILYLASSIILIFTIAFTVYKIMNLLFTIESGLLKIASYENNTNSRNEILHYSELVQKNQRSNSISNAISEHLIKIIGTLQKIADLQISNEILSAKSQLAAEIAHDIRSPLTALNIAMRDPHSKESAEIINSSIERINAISNDLLSSYKKIQSPNASIDQKQRPASNNSLNKSLENFYLEKKLQFKDKTSIEFIYDSNDLTNSQISIPMPDLFRVLSNLINNSFESIKHSGTISLTARNYRDKLVINLLDTGCGMSEDTLSQLGKSGFTLKEENGNGLGVSHAISTIKKYGGDIFFTSRVGDGTNVSITLPKV